MRTNLALLNAVALTTFALTAVAGCGETSWVPSSGPSGYTASGERNLDCSASAVEDYFGDTCAAALGEMLTCWGASGQCTATVDTSGFDVEFASGAVLEHDYASGGHHVNARYVNARGEVCGTFKTSDELTSTGWKIEYETRSGAKYEMRPIGAANDYEILCPNGETVALSSEQQRELQECAGGDAVATCTAPSNFGGNVDIDAIADAIGRPCSSNSECPSAPGFALVCCNFFGDNICYEQTICNAF